MDDKQLGNVIDLFWHGLTRVRRHDLDVEVVPPYLFKATRGGEAFIDATYDLARLNNYVIKMGGSLAWDDSGDPSLEEAMDEAGITDEFERGYIVYAQDEYPFDMDGFVKTSSAASALVITYFWFIKSLKDICRWAEPSLYERKVKSKAFHQNELVTILNILDANTDGTVTKKLYKGRIEIVMSAVQRLRNDYAHGNWGDLVNHIQQLRLVKVFEVISSFLSELETVVDQNCDDPNGPTKLS
jgi:hypothetical protein